MPVNVQRMPSSLENWSLSAVQDWISATVRAARRSQAAVDAWSPAAVSLCRSVTDLEVGAARANAGGSVRRGGERQPWSYRSRRTSDSRPSPTSPCGTRPRRWRCRWRGMGRAEPLDDQVFVVLTGEGLVVKRRRRRDDPWELKSDNPGVRIPGRYGPGPNPRSRSRGRGHRPLDRPSRRQRTCSCSRCLDTQWQSASVRGRAIQAASY